MKLWFSITLLALILFSCKEENTSAYNNRAIKVSPAQGHLISTDSIAKPKVIIIDQAAVLKGEVGTPSSIITNNNIIIAGAPKIVKAGQAKINVHGKDTFALPTVVSVSLNSVLAGVPEVVTAKDAYSKDQNPHSFSTFRKLQGLKHDNVNCLFEDVKGNLWLGTHGAGVTKYDGKSFTHFTAKEGLSSNSVNCILEDSKGNLYFGTYGGGITKYDGKYFSYFNTSGGLPNDDIWSLYEDKKGDIWIGTSGGVSKYDGNSFTNYNSKTGLAGDEVRAIKQDKEGNMWFATYGGGISKYNGKQFENYTETQGLSNNYVFSILEDKGSFWFGTGLGACKFDGVSFTSYNEAQGLANNEVRNILKDQSDNFWFITYSGGASKFNGTTFTNFSEKEGLSSNQILSVIEDKTGNIWFGTGGGGLCKFDGKTLNHFTKNEGLSDNSVKSIIQDNAGNLWFATAEGGVSKYDGKSFAHYTEKEGLATNGIQSVFQDSKNNIWFGTYGAGITKYDGTSFVYYLEKDGLLNSVVWSILEDKQGNLWFGTDAGVSKFDGKSFTNYTIAEGLSDNVVRSMLQDRNGNIWFGTAGGGLTKYDGTKFTHYTESEGLPNNTILGGVEDKLGNLWFGTAGGGVVEYDGTNFIQFTEKEGLANNFVLSALEDKNGNLWFGTRFGLSKISGNRLKEINTKILSKTFSETEVIFKNYTYADGFLGIGVNAGKTLCQTKDGTIWVGSNDRLTTFNYDGNKEDTAAPNIQLTSIELFNDKINWNNFEKKQDTSFVTGNGITISDFKFDSLSKWYSLPENLNLPYNNNFLTFNFIGITLNQPKNVKYQYMLEGLDESWSSLTSKTDAPYGNLPHGDYVFKVKAMNSEGYWSKAFEYKFTIRPPFWKTWWFRILVAIIAISSVWYFIKRRERKLLEEKQKLEALVDERTAEVVLEKEEANKQRAFAEEQKIIVEVKHKEITDSINYAERIQRSFLATKEQLDENLKDYFVFFQPKDVVSGDFYRASKLSNGNFALVTADSTGHGVPGAIMSLLNITSLKEAVKEGLLEPAEILTRTRELIIETLKKDGSPEGGKDGMDCSLISFDFENRRFTYAAANNPIWVVRGNELIELKPDKMPVGKHDKDQIPFTQHEFEMQKGDVVYALTDGMPDQFGGPKGKKFMYKKLKELLVAIAKDPMEDQKVLLSDVLNEWKGDMEQVDDVCLIGVRV